MYDAMAAPDAEGDTLGPSPGPGMLELPGGLGVKGGIPAVRTWQMWAAGWD